MHGRKMPSRLLPATTETRRQVQNLKEIAEVVRKRGQRQGRGQELAQIVRLVSHHLLTERSSLLEELKSKMGPVIKNLYSVFTLSHCTDH